MSNLNKVVVPDIGDFKAVEVIEVNVAVGDSVAAEETLITLESDKASIDIPSPSAGVVRELTVKVGDKVSQDDIILMMEAAEEETPVSETSVSETPVSKTIVQTESASETSTIQQVLVPDIGGAASVTVIELNATVGDKLDAEETILTLESEKASMELPAPFAGIVRELKVKEGDSVSEGSLVAMMETIERPSTQSATEQKAEPPAKQQSSTPAPATTERLAPVIPTGDMPGSKVHLHSTPAVRRLAREFGVDLQQVKGSGRKSRILREDVQDYVKQRLNGETQGAGNSGAGLGLLPWPDVDFSKFGETEEQELSRINKLSAQNLHRNWVMIPHVTQFEEVDITELETFRQENKALAEKEGFKLTPLVFMMKAVASALKQFPSFNASLAPEGDKLILKKYCHVGVAVDTPRGLVVPVVRDVDQKSLFDLAAELGQISSKARALKLTAADMQGSSFTVSSLGGIGGTAFTPIINAPDVAILGVSKSVMKPVYDGESFQPKLMLPLSLSYDHRVIDGAEAARFITYLGSKLSDIRRLLL